MAEEVKLDFYAPFFRAAIVTSDGQRYPLWTQVPGSELRREGSLSDTPVSLGYLQSVAVELQLAGVPRITAVLTPPFDEARRILNSRLVEWTMSTLQVEFGYVGPNKVVLSPLYEGIILPPGIQLGADVSITITAQGTAGFAMVRQQSGSVGDGQALTRIELIRRIAGGANRKSRRRIQVDDSAVLQEIATESSNAAVLASRRLQLETQIAQKSAQLEAVRTSGGDQDRVLEQQLQRELADLQQQQQRTNDSHTQATVYYQRLYEDAKVESAGYLNDWTLIWKLVRECRCTMYLLGNKLIILPANLWFGAPPKRVFRLYDYPQGQLGLFGPSGGTFPILSVSSPTNAVYLPGAIEGLLMRAVSSQTGEEVEEFVTDATVAPERLGPEGALAGRAVDDGVLPDPDSDSHEGASYFSGSPEDPDVRAQAEGEYQSMITGMGIQLELSSLLDPTLFPGDVISVRGVSERHDSNYAIMKINYSVGEGGAEMTLTCFNNAASLSPFQGPADFSALLDKFPTGPVNSQQPEEGVSDTVDSGTTFDSSEQSL